MVQYTASGRDGAIRSCIRFIEDALASRISRDICSCRLWACVSVQLLPPIPGSSSLRSPGRRQLPVSNIAISWWRMEVVVQRLSQVRHADWRINSTPTGAFSGPVTAAMDKFVPTQLAFPLPVGVRASCTVNGPSGRQYSTSGHTKATSSPARGFDEPPSLPF